MENICLSAVAVPEDADLDSLPRNGRVRLLESFPQLSTPIIRVLI